MHNDVTRPSASNWLADVKRDQDKWELDLDGYDRRGGDRLGERSMVFSAKTMLPQSTDAAVWLAIKNFATYAEFRTTLRGCTQYLIDHGVCSAVRAHLVDLHQADPPPQDPAEPVFVLPAAEDFPAGTFASGEARDNFVLVLSRFAQRRQRQTETGTRKGQRPTRAATPRCQGREVRELQPGRSCCAAMHASETRYGPAALPHVQQDRPPLKTLPGQG